MIRLIHLLGIRYVCGSGKIVPFVNQCAALILYAIGVRSPWAQTHENNALAIFPSEIHTALEIHTNGRTHLHIGDNFAGLEFA